MSISEPTLAGQRYADEAQWLRSVASLATCGGVREELLILASLYEKLALQLGTPISSAAIAPRAKGDPQPNEPIAP